MARTPQWPPIKERRNRGGSMSFVLECGFRPKADGGRKRIRLYYKTRQGAEKLGRNLRAIRTEHGLKAAQVHAAAMTGFIEHPLVPQDQRLIVSDPAVVALPSKVNSVAPSHAVASGASSSGFVELTRNLNPKSPTVEEVIKEFIAARIEAKKGEAPTDHEEIMRLVLRNLRPPVDEIAEEDDFSFRVTVSAILDPIIKLSQKGHESGCVAVDVANDVVLLHIISFRI